MSKLQFPCRGVSGQRCQLAHLPRGVIAVLLFPPRPSTLLVARASALLRPFKSAMCHLLTSHVCCSCSPSSRSNQHSFGMQRLMNSSRRIARAVRSQAPRTSHVAVASHFSAAAFRSAVPCRSAPAVAVLCAGRRFFSSSSHHPTDAELQQWQSFNSAGLKFLSEGAFEKASVMFMAAMKEPIAQRTVYQFLSLSNLGIAFRHLKRYGEAKDVLMQFDNLK